MGVADVHVCVSEPLTTILSPALQGARRECPQAAHAQYRSPNSKAGAPCSLHWVYTSGEIVQAREREKGCDEKSAGF